MELIFIVTLAGFVVGLLTLSFLIYIYNLL